MILFFVAALDSSYSAFSIGATEFKPANEDTLTSFEELFSELGLDDNTGAVAAAATGTEKAPVFKNRILYFDTETSGLSPDKGEHILELAVLEYDEDRFISELHCYFNPGKPINPRTIAVHGITDEKVKDEPPFAHRAQELWNFFQNATLIAHNAPFDVRFLNTEFIRAGLTPLTNPVIDTLTMARRIFKRNKNNKICNLCEEFGIPTDETKLHTAIYDAQQLVLVYQELVKRDQ